MFTRFTPLLLVAAAMAPLASGAQARAAQARVLTVKQAYAQCAPAKAKSKRYSMTVQGYYRRAEVTGSPSTTGALFDSNKVPKSAGLYGAYQKYNGLYVVFPPAVRGSRFVNDMHLRVSGTMYCESIHSILQVHSATALKH